MEHELSFYIQWRCHQKAMASFSFILHAGRRYLVVLMGFITAQVLDTKIPCCIIPHEAMKEPITDAVHQRVAQVLTWSLKHAGSGLGPILGEDGCPFDSACRHRLANVELAGGWKLAYAGFRADLKAMVAAHRFHHRYYLCNEICHMCMATKPHVNPHMAYTNFRSDAAYLMTEVSHSDYVRHHAAVSHWCDMPGFCIETVYFDLMHVLWLGTCKSLMASCLGYWHKRDVLDGETLTEQLANFTLELKKTCSENKTPAIYEQEFLMFVVFVFLLLVLPYGILVSELPSWAQFAKKGFESPLENSHQPTRAWTRLQTTQNLAQLSKLPL